MESWDLGDREPTGKHRLESLVVKVQIPKMYAAPGFILEKPNSFCK